MGVRPRVLFPAAVAVALVATGVAACTGVSSTPRNAAASRVEAAAVAAAPTTTAIPTTTTSTIPAPPPRVVVDGAGGTPFATVGGVTLVHPSRRVERVGFHESNHDGARQLEALPAAVAALTLEPRDRGTGSQTAADIVVDPDVEIVSPVTGTVKRAGGYTLYCRYSDDFVVIAPDAQPSWEVKILHITGVQVRRGERVAAGETLLAPRPTQLPFASQVDDHTADPAWPHVHVEVVDPSIKDRPSPGGGC